MRSLSSVTFALAASILAYALAAPHESCTFARKKAAVAAELKTIGDHTIANAEEIPLALGATRTFLVTPNELPEVTIELNVGFSAATVQTELVALAAVLDARVPPSSIHYINNSNGTLTSDFIQTDNIVLPRVHVREIHSFNDACQITNILGYVHGDIICPVNVATLTNAVLRTLCTQIEAAGFIGHIQP